MDDPQIWTLIGVFAAAVLGGMTLMTTLIMRATTSAIDGLRGEMTGRFDGVGAEMNGLRGEMNGRFDAVRAEMTGLRGEMNARFDSVETKIEHLDRDVAALGRKVFGETPER